MLQISRRTFLIFNVGIGLIFAIIGIVTDYAQAIVRPNRAGELPAFQAPARKSIADEGDLEILRAKATFYLDAARDTRRAAAR